jgi:hypothetical protein
MMNDVASGFIIDDADRRRQRSRFRTGRARTA